MSEILWRFADLESQSFSPGAVLIPEGERLGKLFVLASGEVEVLRAGTIVTTVDEPGAIFGEMSVLLDMPHSATVRARSAVEAYAVDDVLEFLKQRPALAVDLAVLVASRLQATTAVLVDLRKQFEGKKEELGFIERIFAALTAPPRSRGGDGGRVISHE